MSKIRAPGLGRKLLFAFALIAGAPVLMGILGWMELRDVARSQATVVNEAIPAISQVRGIVGDSSRAVVVAPELAAVTSEAARAELRAFLALQVNALRDRIAGYAASGLQVPPELAAAAQDLHDQIDQIDRLVRQRISAIERRDRWLQDALAATGELLEIADTLVANAEMSAIAIAVHLYEFEPENTAPDARYDMLDKLIEVDLFQIRLMLDLRAHAAEIGLLLNRVPTVQSLADFNALRAEIQRRAEILGRRVLNVQDPSRAGQAAALIRTFHPTDARPPATDGLFEAAHAVLATEPQLAAAQEALRGAAARLDGQAAALADRIEHRAAAAGAQAEATIRRTQLLYAWGAIISLVLSVLVMWLYVHRNMVRRLDALAADMLELAEHDASGGMQRLGGDEITRMEGAVSVFRHQSEVKKGLEAERDRMLRELWLHRNDLQRLVDEQTEALRHEVTAHDAARARAEAADRAKSDFLAMMSHEIRTPMNGVLGMLRSLSRDSLTPRQTDWLRAALTAGKGLMDILNGLLDTLKADRDAITVVSAPFRLDDLLHDIVLLMTPVAEEKGLSLTLAGDAAAIPAVTGDAGKLRQILFNLVSNAIKFTETGSVTLGTEWDAHGDGAGTSAGTLVLRVSDTGKGIHPEAQERIFEAFMQEDSLTARTHGGTGLGLTICQRLAAQIGAQISVQSRPGAGATFSVTLDLALAARSGPDVLPVRAEDALLIAPPTAGQSRLMLLVVEDNDINQRVIESYLDAMGHHWDLVATGAAAVHRAASTRYDAVLMDVNLPDLSGTEATIRIRALPDRAQAGVPVIGISAHVQERDIANCLGAGMNAVVPKPLMPADLARALASLVRTPESSALAEAVADLGSDRAVRIAQMFIERLPAALDEIARAVDAGDAPGLARAAHQLKGAAGNFALPELVAALERICHTAEQNAVDQATIAARSVPALADQARENLLSAIHDQRALIPAAQ